MEFCSEICLSVDEVIEEMDEDEKEEMYDALCEELNIQSPTRPTKIVDMLRPLSRYELKKVLCDSLYISYWDEENLRTELEKIIKAN